MEKKKILIIEDEKSLVKLISEAIDHEKFKVILAIDADEGMSKVISEKPDLIILDILLPGKNGFEFLKDIKGKKETEKIPVIILSNLGQEEEIRMSLGLGAIDYLVKSDFTIDEVVAKIVKAIEKK